jgi:hypothetical protein
MLYTQSPTPIPTPPTARRGILYFLLALIILDVSYPISELGQWQAIVFQFAYGFLFASGIYVVRNTRRYFWLTVGVGAVTFLTGLIYVTFPQNSANFKVVSIFFFVETCLFQLIILYALGCFIFESKHINRDVIYAAIAVYLLIGATWTPIYGILETLHPGSFVFAANPNASMTWQRLLYYSYVTLTTLGYGDILPATTLAQSLATLEAIQGVLYIAILMARLMSLYVGDAEEARKR